MIIVYNYLLFLMLNVIVFEIDVRFILFIVMGVMFFGVYRICNMRKLIEYFFNIKCYYYDEFIFYF